MYNIKLYNNIAKVGLDQFTDCYNVGEDIENEDAIVVRSANLHELDYNDNLKAIARASGSISPVTLNLYIPKPKYNNLIYIFVIKNPEN